VSAAPQTALPEWAAVTTADGRWLLHVDTTTPDGTRIQLDASARTRAPLVRLAGLVASWMAAAGGRCACGDLDVEHAIRATGGRGACSVSRGPKATPCGCRQFTPEATS